jgi:hypothetical protein
MMYSAMPLAAGEAVYSPEALTPIADVRPAR